METNAVEKEEGLALAKSRVETALEQEQWCIVTAYVNADGKLEYGRVSQEFPDSKLRQLIEQLQLNYNELLDSKKMPSPPIPLPLAPHLQERIERDNADEEVSLYDEDQTADGDVESSEPCEVLHYEEQDKQSE